MSVIRRVFCGLIICTVTGGFLFYVAFLLVLALSGSPELGSLAAIGFGLGAMVWAGIAWQKFVAAKTSEPTTEAGTDGAGPPRV
jgi:hypothetical protein